LAIADRLVSIAAGVAPAADAPAREWLAASAVPLALT
jgi:hypothetical protein